MVHVGSSHHSNMQDSSCKFWYCNWSYRHQKQEVKQSFSVPAESFNQTVAAFSCHGVFTISSADDVGQLFKPGTETQEDRCLSLIPEPDPDSERRPETHRDSKTLRDSAWQQFLHLNLSTVQTREDC